MHVMVSIDIVSSTHLVVSSKVTVTTDASVPKLSPEIVSTSPPRKLIEVMGDIDDAATGTNNSVVISLGIKPLGLVTETIQLPLTALVSKSQIMEVAVLDVTMHYTGPKVRNNSSVVGRLVPVIVRVVPLSD